MSDARQLASPTAGIERPRLRGVLHQWAFFVSVVLGVVLVTFAPPGEARAATLVYAVAVWLVGAAPRISGPAVETVIGANALWAIGSLVVVVTGLGSPTTIGVVWIVLQAVVVGGFAALQVTGLRRR